MKIICGRCKSEAVNQKTGICFSCGLRNKPGVDPVQQQQEALRAEQLAAEKAKQLQQEKANATLTQMAELAEKGDTVEAFKLLKLFTPLSEDMKQKMLKIEAKLWQMQDIPEMQIKILEKLCQQLPFTEPHFNEFYQLACLFQQHQSPGKALNIFQQFIDQSNHFYAADIVSRWRTLKDLGTCSESLNLDQVPTIRLGGLERSVEALRGWLDDASRKQIYFREGIVLNEEDLDRSEKIDLTFNGNITLESIAMQLHNSLEKSGLAKQLKADVKQLVFQHGQKDNKDVNRFVVITPIADSLLQLLSGQINIACAVLFDGNAGASLSFYNVFMPDPPEKQAGKQLAVHAFNDNIYRSVVDVMQIPSPQRAARISSLQDRITKAVREKLEQASPNQGQVFF